MDNAELILSLCEKFHCLPSQLLKEDASFLQLIMIRNMGTKQEGGEYDGE